MIGRAPLIVEASFGVAAVVIAEAGLSFLGLGVQPPEADWGGIVKENKDGIVYGISAALMPAIAIATLTISINLIVDDVSAHSGGKLAKRMI